MSETLRDHTLAWLDSIGADGLTDKDYPNDCFVPKDKITDGIVLGLDRVPAYRHADGSYHTEKEEPCISCHENRKRRCIEDSHKPECGWHQAWLANKEPPSAARR